MWNTQNSSSPSDYWPNTLSEAEKQALYKRLNFPAIVNLRITLDREVEKKAQQNQANQPAHSKTNEA
jgi:hypothetical protein